MIYQPLEAETFTSAADMATAYAARRARLIGKPAQQPRAACLTLVKPEQMVTPPKDKINVGGRPRKVRPRPDADDHVSAYRLHLLRQKEHLSPTELVKLRCLEVRIPFQVITGPGRSRGSVVPARHAIMWELRTARGLSFPQIGRIFNRDHTSVYHACCKIEAEKAKAA